MREGKHRFIKNNIPRNIDSICRNMKTLITLVHRTVTKEDTLFGSKLEFALIVRSKMRPTRTPEHLKKGIVRHFPQKTLKRCLHIDHSTWESIDKKASSGESITPKPIWSRSMCKKSQPSFNNVSMFSFSSAILLMCMSARHSMRDAKISKELV
jgi:hypothetical protein